MLQTSDVFLLDIFASKFEYSRGDFTYVDIARGAELLSMTACYKKHATHAQPACGAEWATITELIGSCALPICISSYSLSTLHLQPFPRHRGTPPCLQVSRNLRMRIFCSNHAKIRQCHRVLRHGRRPNDYKGIFSDWLLYSPIFG